MRVVRWPADEAPPREPTVVTVGVFDGVHGGHAEVIRVVVSEARERACRSAIVTFDRHPAAVIAGRVLPAITSLEHRLRLFEDLQVDLCVVIRFSSQVADIPAAEFARRVFADYLSAVLVVLGYDCRFGQGRAGDAESCAALGPELGFGVRSVPPVEFDGEPISSTAIREAIVKGDFAAANRLLGRPFALYGNVVAGDGRGKHIGFPTANLDPRNETIPPDGVYAAWVLVEGGRAPGVVSIGRRETFHGPDAERVVEVHLIGRRAELHGTGVEVEFVRFLRPQQAFGSGGELAAQIVRDVQEAMSVLSRSGHSR